MQNDFPNEKPLYLSDKSYIQVLDFDEFPLVQDFIIEVRQTKSFGLHLYFHSVKLGQLASFPWWDRVDKSLRNYTAENIPLGSLQEPFDDTDQGWQILIFEHAGAVYILEGADPCCTKFHSWFCVSHDLYFKEWMRTIRCFNPAA